ncbi:mechanosensitive ion channel family protein [Planktothricoides sp. SR001]|uniref:mechanosensitive ion channel family protein n=1 Tax=Planktothricoides sp. SR001 TaxID=1705388 RepID=UPI000A80225A|nr:mechanosensitive ion channel domain-containing protein [Planktothricoides sp. SR001]
MSNYRNRSLTKLTTVDRLLRWIICGVLGMVLVLWISPKGMTLNLPRISDALLVSSRVGTAPSLPFVEGQLSDRQYIASVFNNWIELYLKKAKAPVTLDGQELFFVTDTAEHSAELRAQLISEKLEEAVASENPVQVKVNQSNNQLTIISLNNQQLLTVTSGDAAPRTPQERAQEWADKIQQSLTTGKQQRQFDFIVKGLIYSAAIVFAAISLHSLSDKLLRQFWQKISLPNLTEDSEQRNLINSLDLLRNLTIGTARVVIWLFAALGISNLFPVTRQWSYLIVNALITTFTSPILTLGQQAYSIPDILLLGFLLFGLVNLSWKATDLFKSRILQITGMNRGTQEVIAVIFRYSAIALGTVVVLQIWGLDLSSLTILASALGIVIGLGFQDIAKNFASGLILLFERPIQVGDFVEVGRYTGIVEYIGARSTTIRTLDRISIILPNARFLENEVINWSHSNPVSRLHIPIGVAYSSDVQVVESTLLEAAKSHPLVLLVPPPKVMFLGFGDNSLNFELLVWIDQPSELFTIKSDLNFKIQHLLLQHEIEIPFPQRDLHVRSGSIPLQISTNLEETLIQVLQKFLAKDDR